MADVADEPGSRGTTHVEDRAVTHLAARSALEVDGVANARDVSGRVSHLLGRDYPRTTVTTAGQRARLTLEIALLWPRSASEVAAAVRDRVREQLGSLLDIQADSVAVEVRRVVSVPPREGARVR
ncbi:Asp23/Gls24 family envelope stress response protein [Cellulomonas sp. P22]|uniref:Asp23/Gls24 family envelope stress response protein n=1 Tax=Cellulomonas sp. P22 TaxID=3373189 RepID=UPI00379D480E